MQSEHDFSVKPANSCCISDASIMSTERMDIGKLDTRRWQHDPALTQKGVMPLLFFLAAKTFMISVAIIVINAIYFAAGDLLIKNTAHTLHCKYFCIFSIGSGSCSHLAAL